MAGKPALQRETRKAYPTITEYIYIIDTCRTSFPRSGSLCYLAQMNNHSRHPPRLIPFQKFGQPVWFITFGTLDRKPILAREAVYRSLLDFGKRQALRGIAIGRHVVMPDHLHFFLRLAPGYEVGTTIGFVKKALSAVLTREGISAPHWQPGFFDHLIRDAVSYSEKWAYVVQNPVRAGLVASPDQWPYSGEIVRIEY